MTLPDVEPLTTMDDRLRQVPIDDDVFAEALAGWGEERDVARSLGDVERLRRALGMTGTAYRILQRWDEAERDLCEARAMATGRQIDTAEIRIAELDRCRNRFDAAIARLDAVLAGLPGDSPLRSFALQHLGKALCDAGRPDCAIPVLELALALREASGESALIASTKQAIDHARTRT